VHIKSLHIIMDDIRTSHWCRHYMEKAIQVEDNSLRQHDSPLWPGSFCSYKCECRAQQLWNTVMWVKSARPYVHRGTLDKTGVASHVKMILRSTQQSTSPTITVHASQKHQNSDKYQRCESLQPSSKLISS